MKNKLDSLFFTRLFVPQAPQNSFYRRAESEIQLAIPPMQCVCGMESIRGIMYEELDDEIALKDLANN